MRTLSLLFFVACSTADPDDSTPDPADTNAADTAADTGPDDTGPDNDPCALDGFNGEGAAAPILSAAVLQGSSTPSQPIDEAAFRPQVGAGDPLHTFSGSLQFSPENEQRNLLYAIGWLTADTINAPLPTIDAEYVQCGRHLAPVSRSRTKTDSAHWDLLLAPGQIWSNPDDGGLSRVSLPFSLTLKYINCVHNGSMTFLYDGSSISNVRYQITQETCHLFQFDSWGQSEATLDNEISDLADEARDALLEELDQRPPTAPFSELEATFPGAEIADLDLGLTLDDLSARGFLVGGTLYLDDCRTRYGTYSFCDEMILPSFSLAKTVFTGAGLAAMAAEYSPDPLEETLGALLNAGGSWAPVTVENALDMATGHYLYDNMYDWDVPGFYTSLDLDARLEATFGLPKVSEPGENVVYLTPNSQVVAAAMDAHLENVGADITDGFDYLVDRVLKPAGLTPDSFDSLRTWESGQANNGTAFGGYGMWFTPHGITNFSAFLQRGGDGVLDTDHLAEMMFQTSDLGADMNYWGFRYNNGMWAYPIPGCDTMTPIMFGVSGITVILLPNDMVYFAFNDAQEQPITNILSVADQIQSLCE